MEDEVKEGVTSFRGGFEKSDLNGGDKEESMSLGVELWRGLNGMKDEIEEVMRVYRITS